MLFKFKEEGVRIELAYGILDVSEDKHQGYKPEHLLVSAIAGSSAQVFTDLLARHHTHIDDFFIRSEVTRDEDENRISRIKLHFVVKGKNLNIDKLYRILESARAQCAIIRSVEDSIEIVETLETVEIKY